MTSEMLDEEMKNKDDEHKYDKLYDFWNDIPVIKIVNSDHFNITTDHHYRNAIVQILRKGIPDKNGRLRHALSLKEMIDPIEEYLKNEFKIEENIKLTALYHHRDILVESEILKEIDTILEGKRYVTYYGRTAKAFIADFEGSAKGEVRVEMLKILIKNLHPDIDVEKEYPIVKNLEVEINKAHEKTVDWIENHVDLINRLDLDTIVLYQFLLPFFAYNNEMSNSVRELLDLK